VGIVTIPNRPAGTDIRSIEQILADFDAITSVINGNLDASNFQNTPQAIIQKPTNLNNTAANSLTNSAFATTPTPCASTVSLTTGAVATVSARTVIDKIAGAGSVYMALMMDNAQILDSRYNGGSSIYITTSIAGTPIVSFLFETTNTSPGLQATALGGTDWTGVPSSTPMLSGAPIDIWIPSGTHTLSLQYRGDAGITTYNVISQLLCVKV